MRPITEAERAGILRRLLEHTAIQDPPEGIEGPCCIWTGCTQPKGYGLIAVASGRGGKPELIHRVAWAILRPPLPDLQLHHECRRQGCWNPWHVTPETAAEHNREHHRTGFCRKGHRMAGSNIRNEADGKRRCAVCYATTRGRPVLAQWLVDAG